MIGLIAAGQLDLQFCTVPCHTVLHDRCLGPRGRAGGTWAGELWSTSSIVFGRRRQEEGSIRGLIRLRAAQWLRDSLSLRLLLSESREDELAKPSKERSALEGACFLAERWVVEVD